MSFTRSQIFLACALASSLLFSACSKENKPQKEDALTATAPATGEASTIIERNAKQRLIETLQKQVCESAENMGQFSPGVRVCPQRSDFGPHETFFF